MALRSGAQRAPAARLNVAVTCFHTCFYRYTSFRIFVFVFALLGFKLMFKKIMGRLFQEVLTNAPQGPKTRWVLRCKALYYVLLQLEIIAKTACGLTGNQLYINQKKLTRTDWLGLHSIRKHVFLCMPRVCTRIASCKRALGLVLRPSSISAEL